MVRKKVACFKEGKQMFGHNGLHSLRDERSDCNRAIVWRVRFVTFLGIGKTWASFHEENTKIVGRLEKLVEDRGEFRGTGF